MKLALAIPHAAHKAERKASLERLLGVIRNTVPGDEYRIFSEKEPHWKWSLRLWKWGLETGADFLVQLQDDVVVPENFWGACRASDDPPNVGDPVHRVISPRKRC